MKHFSFTYLFVGCEIDLQFKFCLQNNHKKKYTIKWASLFETNVSFPYYAGTEIIMPFSELQNKSFRE